MSAPGAVEHDERGAGLAALVLAAFVVAAGPLVLVPALLVRWLLGWRWPDRLVAALLGAVAASGLALVWLGGYGAAWLSVARWAVARWTPWLQGSPAPTVAAWLLLAGAGILAGTLYGALRWWTAQAAAERDLYDGKEEQERRQRAEERRRRRTVQTVQRWSRGSRAGALLAPLAVPLGDARGPFVGVYQRGPLGGPRVTGWRRPEDRLWRAGTAVRVPLGPGSPVQHVVVLGATGVGKTESTLRFCEWALSQRWQVIYLSAKEPPSPREAAAPRLTRQAEPLGRTSRVLLPEVSPFDALRGDLADVRDRLVAMEAWGEPYWEHVANLLLAIALETGTPVEGLADLVASLTPTRMRSQVAASGDPRVQEIVAALGDRDVAGALARYASLAVSLRGWVGTTASPDTGSPMTQLVNGACDSWAWEDADLCVAELPMSTRPKAGRALLRLMVRDLGAYLTDPDRRRMRDGRPVPLLLVVEEVGALSGDPVVGAEFVSLVERARSAGAVCVLTAQDPAGLGEDRVRDAVLTNAATLTYRQTTAAELVAGLAGTAEVRADEASRTYDERGLGTGGSTRRQYVMALNPQELRRLGMGEAALVALGRFCTVAAVRAESGYGRPEPLAAAVPAPAALPGPETGADSPEPREALERGGDWT